MTFKAYTILKSNWRFIIFLLVSMVLSAFPRNNFMHHISSNWRSSQTLLTSFWFQKEGISLFHSQLPIYGPSWEVPFELPVYQAISVMFSNITHLNLTASSRVVSVASFYVSAIFLLLLCLELLNNKTLSSIIFLLYIWLPYNIRFSTEILIDYLSVALALGYLFWIKKFLDSPRNIILFSLAIIFGCLGATIKITTMVITITPAIFIALDGIHMWGIEWEDMISPKKIFVKIGKQKLPFSLLTAIAILPVLSEEVWTKFTDGIKQNNIFTAWLTTGNLNGWVFGTLDMKTNFTNWLNWLMKINNYFFLGGILLVFLIFGIVLLYKMPLKSRFFFGTALVGTLLTIFIFFNLYLHEYYYIAVSSYLSILIGFGVYCTVKFLLPHKIWWIVISAIFSFFILLAGIAQYKGFQAEVQAEINYENASVIPLAKKVTAITPENNYIISFQSSWWPDFILYTQRKGLIMSPREYGKYSCDLVNKYSYSTIVVVDSALDVPNLLGIFNCFKSVELIESGIYIINP